MAAWQAPTGPCSGSPTFSTARSIGRKSRKPPRSVRPTWPDCRPGFFPNPTGSLTIGAWNAALRRKWTRQSVRANWRIGHRQCAGCLAEKQPICCPVDVAVLAKPKILQELRSSLRVDASRNAEHGDATLECWFRAQVRKDLTTRAEIKHGI